MATVGELATAVAWWERADAPDLFEALTAATETDEWGEHDLCTLTACRAPLHPGPCKGWKHTLHLVSPGAFHALERQRVDRLNQRRMAKIAQLKAQGKKIPPALLKEIQPRTSPGAPPAGWTPGHLAPGQSAADARANVDRAADRVGQKASQAKGGAHRALESTKHTVAQHLAEAKAGQVGKVSHGVAVKVPKQAKAPAAEKTPAAGASEKEHAAAMAGLREGAPKVDRPKWERAGEAAKQEHARALTDWRGQGGAEAHAVYEERSKLARTMGSARAEHADTVETIAHLRRAAADPKRGKLERELAAKHADRLEGRATELDKTAKDAQAALDKGSADYRQLVAANAINSGRSAHGLHAGDTPWAQKDAQATADRIRGEFGITKSDQHISPIAHGLIQHEQGLASAKLDAKVAGARAADIEAHAAKADSPEVRKALNANAKSFRDLEAQHNAKAAEHAKAAETLRNGRYSYEVRSTPGKSGATHDVYQVDQHGNETKLSSSSRESHAQESAARLNEQEKARTSAGGMLPSSHKGAPTSGAVTDPSLASKIENQSIIISKNHAKLPAAVRQGAPDKAIDLEIGSISSDGTVKTPDGKVVGQAIGHSRNDETWQHVRTSIPGATRGTFHTVAMYRLPAATTTSPHYNADQRTVANLARYRGTLTPSQLGAMEKLSDADYRGLDEAHKVDLHGRLRSATGTERARAQALADKFDHLDGKGKPAETPAKVEIPAQRTSLAAQRAVKAAGGGTAKAKLDAYQGLSKGDYDSLGQADKTKIARDLVLMHAKFADPKKQDAVAAVQAKLGSDAHLQSVDIPAAKTQPSYVSPHITEAKAALAGKGTGVTTHSLGGLTEASLRDHFSPDERQAVREKLTPLLSKPGLTSNEHIMVSTTLRNLDAVEGHRPARGTQNGDLKRGFYGTMSGVDPRTSRTSRVTGRVDQVSRIDSGPHQGYIEATIEEDNGQFTKLRLAPNGQPEEAKPGENARPLRAADRSTYTDLQNRAAAQLDSFGDRRSTPAGTLDRLTLSETMFKDLTPEDQNRVIQVLGQVAASQGTVKKPTMREAGLAAERRREYRQWQRELEAGKGPERDLRTLAERQGTTAKPRLPRASDGPGTQLSLLSKLDKPTFDTLPDADRARVIRQLDALGNRASGLPDADRQRAIDLHTKLRGAPTGEAKAAEKPETGYTGRLAAHADAALNGSSDLQREVNIGRLQSTGDWEKLTDADRAKLTDYLAARHRETSGDRQAGIGKLLAHASGPQQAQATEKTGRTLGASRPLTKAARARVRDTLTAHIDAINKAGGNPGTFLWLRGKAESGELTAQQIRDVVNSLAITRLGQTRTPGEKAEQAAGMAVLEAMRHGGKTVDPKTADIARWRAGAAKPGVREVAQPTPRQERLAEFRKELAEAEDKLAKVKAAHAAEVKRKRSGIRYEREQEMRKELGQAQIDVDLAQRHIEAVEKIPHDPGYYDKAAAPKRVGAQPIDPKRPLAVYGDLLHIEDESAATHKNLTELEKVPAHLHAVVRDNLVLKPGGGIYTGDVMVTDLDGLGYLRTEQPRGWPNGRTWSNVPGAYHPSRGVLALGHDHSHGSSSLGLHEFGHAADDAIGHQLGGIQGVTRASHMTSFRAAHKALLADAAAGRPVNPYYLQGGDAGPSETWAEAFAAWSAAKHAGTDPAQSIEKVLKSSPATAKLLADYYAEVERKIQAKKEG